MGLFWGALRDRIRAQLATLVAPWFQGGSRAQKGVILSHFGVSFGGILEYVVYDFLHEM